MWKYTDKVMDHFLHPHNVGEIPDADAVAEVGNITCGDALKLYLKLDSQGKISDVKFKTFGCASAIASSSVLTDLVKGKTLDEAAKITNKDIVEVLGGLPEAKMHCSVMGMEALQAAIADYRKKHGGHYEETDSGDDHDGRIVCKCFGVTDTKIRKTALANNLHTAEEITDYTKAGGGCGRCLDQIQEILDGVWREHDAVRDSVPETAHAAAFNALSVVQQIIRINEVIDKEIRPALEKDGGRIEFVDLDGDTVKVRLKGLCAGCPNAELTLKKLVEAKLHEFISAKLTVTEAE